MDVEIVISTTTDTGLARAKAIFPGLTIFRYPLDFSPVVSRALDRIAPSMVVLVELEVWFQFVTIASERGIPVVVVNGRLSKRSGRRFGYIRPIARRMFSRLAWVGAQDEAYARRFVKVGVPADRVTVTGSVKWDTAEVADTIAGSDALAEAMGIDPTRPVWVCGSTGPGEEAVALDAYARLREQFDGLQLVIVPRKPERFDEVAGGIAQRGFACVRRSARLDGSSHPADPEVGRYTHRRDAGATPHRLQTGAPGGVRIFLGDTMGELRKFYSLADVVFVGRSLAGMGGSDMMEVAALARPIVVGPHTENFAEPMAQLRADEAVREVKAGLDDPGVAEELAAAVGALLEDTSGARAMAERGRGVVMRNRGATERTLKRLIEILEAANGPPAEKAKQTV